MKDQKNCFIKSLSEYKGIFSEQQIKTLKGQALNGDVMGAQKGLQKLIKRQVQGN